MKISLVDFDKKHIDKTFDWIQDEELRRLFLMRGEISYNKHLDYFEKVLNDPTQKVYAILDANLHVGNCGVKNLDFSEKKGEAWIYIGDTFLRNKGIGHEALKLQLINCFGSLNLEKVYLHVADFNEGAIKLYERNGFKRTVPVKGDVIWSGRGCKVLFFELWRQEWEAMSA